MTGLADSLLAVKVFAAVAILLVAIGGGLIPIAARHWQQSRRFLSLGNALAGGIFLGGGFLHLLPEAAEALKGAVEYPLAPLLAATGVCLLLLIERVVLDTHSPGGPAPAAQQAAPVQPLALLLALSAHSIIAGIALGVEGDLSTSLLVLLAILFHKGSAAFALVVSSLASGASDKRAKSALFAFSTMTPLGIGLGTAGSTVLEGQLAAVVTGCFGALAAGTFIYVGILDVINEELASFEDRVANFTASALIGDDDVPMPIDDPDRVTKFVLVVAGLACMAVLGLWV